MLVHQNLQHAQAAGFECAHLHLCKCDCDAALGSTWYISDFVCLQSDLYRCIGVQKGYAKMQTGICDALQKSSSPPVDAHMTLSSRTPLKTIAAPTERDLAFADFQEQTCGKARLTARQSALNSPVRAVGKLLIDQNADPHLWNLVYRVL